MRAARHDPEGLYQLQQEHGELQGLKVWEEKLFGRHEGYVELPIHPRRTEAEKATDL